MSTMNCTNVGSVYQTRFSSGVSMAKKSGFWSALRSDFCHQTGQLNNGGLRLVLDGFLGLGRLPYDRRQGNSSNSSRGMAIRCSSTVPDSNEHTPLNSSTTTTIAEEEGGGNHASKESSPDGSRIESIGGEPAKAAFFDVDGTITRTNVVMAYLCVRMVELSFVKKLVWVPWFLASCLVYLIVDHFHRPTFNRIFYSSYKGRPTDGKAAMANLVFESYYKPRIMAGAAEQILELKQLGYHIVLVTGALDFQIEPLARELDADFVYAATLVEENGRFTGGLQGMANSNHEKAERIWDYAKRHGVSLRDSLAFGDSIADIPMLEVVGRPYAVNPDARLLTIALKRGWTVLDWKVKNTQNTAASVWAILKWRIHKNKKAAPFSA